jgi:alpha-L-fucosidase 2
VWLCQHIWEHWLYTGDIEFLREYYPVMKGSAQFLMDIMTVHPGYGYLVIPFSMSPEQGFYVSEGAEEAFIAPATTMNTGLIKDLFPHCIEAARLLDTDADFSNSLGEALGRIPPYMIGKDSLLQVWIEDWKRGNEGHDMSANLGFYPGNSITLRDNPDLAAAIRKWLEPRRVSTSWPSAWDICYWARLEDGVRADTVIRKFFLARTPWGGIGNNLHNTAFNQSDANFGYTAGVAECLLQSHAGEISILPALPVSWKDGSVTGLRARGGFEVDIAWKDGRLVKAKITSLLGNPCVVRANGKTSEYNPARGETVVINGM